MIPAIDAHHHLWQYSAAEYGWIGGTMAPLRRDFLPHDLHIEMHAAGVDTTIAVQARQTLAETDWLLRVAHENPFIAGVVGWAPLASDRFASILESIAGSRLKGLRHVVQDEPDPDFILGANFNRGISALTRTGLVYEILIYERHLPQAIQFVDRHPNQSFVLDHLAKPKIRAGELHPWRDNLCELARRPNVACKISGLVTEADWANWSPQTLLPYFETALQAFGPHRLLAGSDWPVCLVATSYERWWQTVRDLVAQLSPSEQAAILADNAARLYNLSDSDSGTRNPRRYE